MSRFISENNITIASTLLLGAIIFFVNQPISTDTYTSSSQIFPAAVTQINDTTKNITSPKAIAPVSKTVPTPQKKTIIQRVRSEENNEGDDD